VTLPGNTKRWQVCLNASQASPFPQKFRVDGATVILVVKSQSACAAKDNGYNAKRCCSESCWQ